MKHNQNVSHVSENVAQKIQDFGKTICVVNGDEVRVRVGDKVTGLGLEERIYGWS